MMNRSTARMICLLLLFMPLQSCMDDAALWERSWKPDDALPYEGVFIVNEGNFMYQNASLTFYDIGFREVHHDVFYQANAIPLGDVAQSMTVRDSLGYVVMNNSGKIQIIHIHDFRLVGKITGLTSPRYIHFLSDTKAYVSDLYAQSITIVNPARREITGSIALRNPASDFYQHPTEQMVQHGRLVFVSCWSYDDKILVIDSESDALVDSIGVIKQPGAMVIDRHGKLWVLSDGGFPDSPYGRERAGLTRIDADSRRVEKIIRFSPGDSPADLAINGTADTLYFINRHVYRLPVISEGEPQVFIESPYTTEGYGGFKALGIDPQRSDIYAADAIDLVQKGITYRFRPDAQPVDTIRTGIIPTHFCFKPARD